MYVTVDFGTQIAAFRAYYNDRWTFGYDIAYYLDGERWFEDMIMIQGKRRGSKGMAGTVTVRYIYIFGPRFGVERYPFSKE